MQINNEARRGGTDRQTDRHTKTTTVTLRRMRRGLIRAQDLHNDGVETHQLHC